MKRAFGIVIALVAIAGGLAWFLRTPGYINFPPRSGTTWVAFGDSLTAGFGASPGNDYPSLLGRELAIPIVNGGVSGNTTQNGLDRLDDILRLQPKVVLLCLGGNDGLRGVPIDQTLQNLRQIIDRLHQAGAFVVLIGIRSASLLDRNSGRFEKLARERKVFYVPDILKGVFGNPELMSDGIHPNDAGYAAIARRLERELGPLLSGLDPR